MDGRIKQHSMGFTSVILRYWPSKISFSRKQNVRIWRSRWKNGPDNLTIHPLTAPLENVSRWLTTAQVTYGIVIEDLQFTLAGNEEITLRHLSFREQQ